MDEHRDARNCERPRRVAVLSSSRWSPFRGSIHYLSLALAELGHEVLYVDPPVSPTSLVRHPDRLQDLRGPTLATLAPRVRRWIPRVVPGQNSAIGQRLNARLISAGLDRL